LLFCYKAKSGRCYSKLRCLPQNPLKSRYGSGKCEGVRIIYTTRLKSDALVLLGIDATVQKSSYCTLHDNYYKFSSTGNV
ncbi:MAG: hypothetical protein LAC70_02330, partial [Methylovulum sp.]|nr:hypothetical protein [Methylovulum sp.]